MDKNKHTWKEKAYIIIFRSDTFAGRLFDIILLALILLSVALVLLESIQLVNEKVGPFLRIAEWIITIAFTIEYVLRILVSRKPWSYIFSFYGVIDLLAILPTYMSVVATDAHKLIIIRALRLLRVFRILKLNRYTEQGVFILRALRASWPKISVFLFAILMIVLIMGTLMYLVEGPEHGFVSIPVSIYWAIVTLTTVGYGDLTPVTAIGKFISSLVMIIGYSIIAVPTGIVSAELSGMTGRSFYRNNPCQRCKTTGHAADAVYCRKCGTMLEDAKPEGKNLSDDGV